MSDVHYTTKWHTCTIFFIFLLIKCEFLVHTVVNIRDMMYSRNIRIKMRWTRFFLNYRVLLSCLKYNKNRFLLQYVHGRCVCVYTVYGWSKAGFFHFRVDYFHFFVWWKAFDLLEVTENSCLRRPYSLLTQNKW